MMALRAVVEQHQGRLSAADRQLIRELLEDPTQAAFLSTTDLAHRIGVHQATVVRLAKKLGFEGYPQLRRELQAEVLERSGSAERVRRRLAHTRGGDVLGPLIAGEVSALQHVAEHVEQSQFDAAAEALMSAQRVFLFAQGHATALLEMMDRRLRRSGFATVDLRGRGRDLAERLLTISRKDAVLAFAFRVRPHGFAPFLRHARAVGAATILVSDLSGAMMRPRPKILLAAPRGGEGEFQTLTVPMAICNALVLTIARLDRGRSIDALERLDRLIREFERDEVEYDGARARDRRARGGTKR